MATRVAFVGLRSGVGTTTLAVNVATVLGVVARRKTLLLDLCGSARGVCHHLGISNVRGLFGLTTPWLRSGHISAAELTQQVTRYEPGEPWQPGVSALDILPGFDRAMLSPADAERVFAYREIQLVSAVCQTARLAGYEYVLSDNGAWRDSPEKAMWASTETAMALNAEGVVLVNTSTKYDVRSVWHPFRLLRSKNRSVLVAFNLARRWFKMAYGDLEGVPYEAVPPAKEAFLAECEKQKVPAVLRGLERASWRRDRFTAALLAVAGRLNPQLDEVMLDSRGRQL